LWAPRAERRKGYDSIAHTGFKVAKRKNEITASFTEVHLRDAILLNKGENGAVEAEIMLRGSRDVKTQKLA
jgi:hypothetical protein